MHIPTFFFSFFVRFLSKFRQPGVWLNARTNCFLFSETESGIYRKEKSTKTKPRRLLHCAKFQKNAVSPASKLLNNCLQPFTFTNRLIPKTEGSGFLKKLFGLK